MIRKYALTTGLAALMVLAVTMGPGLINSAHMRLMAARNPLMFTVNGVTGKFTELFTEFVTNAVINGAIGGSASARVASVEKKMMQARELVQSKINQAAANKTSEVIAQAATKFPNGAGVDRACRIAQEEAEASNAFINSSLETKALSATGAIDFNDGGSALAKSVQVLATHNDNYCSEEAFKRGRCTSISANPDADIKASSLLDPGEEGQTMTKEQYDAARSFIKMVTDPVPPEDLPNGLEKTPAGQRYILERKQYTASMTLAQQTYNKMLGARTAGNMTLTGDATKKSATPGAPVKP